jgi:predicted dehydrogenase
MGRRHARVLCALRDRFDVVGAYDVRPEVQPFENIEPLRSDTEAVARGDVVVVATPMDAHANIAARALAAGRHVLVEKPLCANSAEAYRLVAAARGGARLFVGHSERFNPVVRALVRLLRGQPLVAIDLRRVGPSQPNAGSALVSVGVHDFDLAAYLGGGEVVFQSALGTSPHDAGEDFAHVLFHTASGAVGHVHVDGCAPARQRILVLTTRHWVYEGDLLAHRLVRTSRRNSGSISRPDCVRTEVPLPLEEPLHAQAIALADALDGSAARELATGLDGARAVELAERALAHVACARLTARTESLRQGP